MEKIMKIVEMMNKNHDKHIELTQELMTIVSDLINRVKKLEDKNGKDD